MFHEHSNKHKALYQVKVDLNIDKISLSKWNAYIVNKLMVIPESNEWSCSAESLQHSYILVALQMTICAPMLQAKRLCKFGSMCILTGILCEKGVHY